MTENKAIEWLRAISATQNQSSHSASLSDRKEALYMAIQALGEIQEFRKQGITIEKALDMMCDLAGAENLIEQYRAIGTPTQIYEKIGGLDVELGKYHAIGTIEEFKALKDCGTHDCIIKHLTNECSYKETGCSDCKSIEMIRTAVERMKPKKPTDIVMAKDRKICVGRVGKCPCCGSIVAEGNFTCDDCFQVLDWSE